MVTFLTNSSYAVSLQTSSSATLLSLYKLSGTVFNLSISRSSKSDFKLAKSTNFDVSTPVALFKSDFVA